MSCRIVVLSSLRVKPSALCPISASSPLVRKLRHVSSRLPSANTGIQVKGITVSQRALHQSLSSQTSSMTSPSDEAKIDEILAFWFSKGDQPDLVKWFGGGKSFDAECEPFRGDVRKARSGNYNKWLQSPRGTIALILLLDQFPRNLYRGSGETHDSDCIALKIAVDALADGRTSTLPVVQRVFVLLPLMHAEDLLAQIACISLAENIKSELPGDSSLTSFLQNNIDYGKRHLDTVRRFGRFPSRNVILGRETTEEEKSFLEEKPEGF